MKVHPGVRLSACVVTVHSLGLVLACRLAVLDVAEVVDLGDLVVGVDFLGQRQLFGQLAFLSMAQSARFPHYFTQLLCLLLH